MIDIRQATKWPWEVTTLVCQRQTPIIRPIFSDFEVMTPGNLIKILFWCSALVLFLSGCTGNRGKTEACYIFIGKIGYALQEYDNNHGHFPGSLSALSPDYLFEIPRCPLHGQYIYKLGGGNNHSFTLECDCGRPFPFRTECKIYYTASKGVVFHQARP